MKTCFAYIRVSTVKQGDGVSLEAQREAITLFAQRHDIAISKWFEEKETAAKKGRPIFNRMVSELQKGGANGLIAHRIDRGARNFADWARIGELADAGFDIHFATESLDFRSRGGRLAADVQAVVAADYIRNLREECIKGLNGRLKQGFYPFKAPLGYNDNGGGKPKTIDPVRGPLVKTMFELYATGNYSLWSLVPEINGRGLRNERGQPVSKQGVEKMLRNPFYAGIMFVKSSGKSYPGIHKPLISVDLYRKVADIREGRDNKKVTKHGHRYRGLFRCMHCDQAMIPEKQKGRVYYRCQLKPCITKTVREDMIEAEVQSLLKRFVLSDRQVEIIYQKFVAWVEAGQVLDQAEKAPFEIIKLKERLSRLTDKYVDEMIDTEIYQAKKTEILLDTKKWEALAAQTTKKGERLAQIRKFLELVRSLYTQYVSALAEQKREIVKMATSNRLVDRKNIMIEPPEWLLMIESLLDPAYSEQCNTTSRTFDALIEQYESLAQLGNLQKAHQH
ncbi:recombinase family protein [Parasphingorhabdus halotolerans]|uniref:Recombinase family protein n=1 Tax=Parasphingorhabdus halotolerans TaxID=2725558 RepID=A0A6H2DP04_9SPHN|nr:recombinase family protein [Parasphingorhabdus halotolerans]QJB69867.1 recombinase family protein [Parasphingorhabdus halotolerans]